MASFWVIFQGELLKKKCKSPEDFNKCTTNSTHIIADVTLGHLRMLNLDLDTASVNSVVVTWN